MVIQRRRPSTSPKPHKPATEPVALILKITLRGLRPPVWRRVRVAGDSTLRMLHRVIQAAMGWQDYHLHEFEIGDRRYGEPDGDPWPGPNAPMARPRSSSAR